MRKPCHMESIESPYQGHDVPSNDGDAPIITRVIAGEVDAFALLVQRYQHEVFRVVSRHIPRQYVEETAHEVFIKAFQSLAKCQHRDHFAHWLAAIAVRTCYDFWRKSYRNRELPLSDIADEQRENARRIIDNRSYQSFCDQDGQRRSRELLEYALAHFNAEDRMVLTLIYLEDMPLREAAQLLGWSIANIKVRAFRCKKKLRQVLTRLLQGE